MTFAIYASKYGERVVTLRISADATLDKARALEGAGWLVYIVDSGGHQFDVSEFDRSLLVGRSPGPQNFGRKSDSLT